MIGCFSQTGLLLLKFLDKNNLGAELSKNFYHTELIHKSTEHSELLGLELADFFGGKRKKFSVPLDISGDPFQRKVWHALMGIPYGATISYKEQALALNNEKAIRAVAKANGQNRIVILVPCHRVIGHDGSLVGYNGGLERKRFLLDLERNNSDTL